MTPYALLLQSCGLSQSEAAEFHGVRLDTIKSWNSGRAPARPGAIAELRALYAQIVVAAENALGALRDVAGAAEIEIGYPADNDEARALGFPCVGAWRAMCGLVIVKLDQSPRLVPRGLTRSAASAIAAHNRQT